MKRTNFIALLLAIMVVISAVFCAGAVTDVQAKEVTSAQYRIPVNGDKPISNEAEYTVKVMTFDATYNGATENIIIWVSKAEQKSPRLEITDSSGKLLNPDESDYCYSRKSNELTNGDFFTVTIKGGKLITACDGEDSTRDMLMLKGMTFANVALFNGAYDTAVGSAPPQTQPVERTTQSVQPEEEATQPEENAATQENKENKKSSGIGWLILAIAAIVVAFGCLTAFIVLNKKSAKPSGKASKPQIQNSSRKIPAASYTPPRRTKTGDEAKPDTVWMNYSENGDIPISKRRTASELPIKAELEMYNIEVKYPQPYTAAYDINAAAPQAEENKEPNEE